MTTYQTTFLSEPTDDKRILPETLAYMRSRAKRRAYDLVIKEFKKSGLTKAQLARRLGKGADRISKMLGGPNNWTIETVSDLLFAISAGEMAYRVEHPLTLNQMPKSIQDLNKVEISFAGNNSETSREGSKFFEFELA